MRDNITTYKIWAPADARWTQWVKPVLFASSPQYYHAVKPNKINWLPVLYNQVMIIVDIPGEEGIEEGLGLTEYGFRPIPLYNGVAFYSGQEIVKVREIVAALYGGADMLEGIKLRSDAPLAFLLDSNRMKGHGKVPGSFDNRWCVFPQDMPSASYLQEKGIKRVLVRAEEIQNDLSHILCRYQKAGINVAICDESGNIKELKIVKPSKFKCLRYRFLVAAGLTRNPAGGFGGSIPDAQTSGARHYGMG